MSSCRSTLHKLVLYIRTCPKGVDDENGYHSSVFGGIVQHVTGGSSLADLMSHAQHHSKATVKPKTLGNDTLNFLIHYNHLIG